MNKRDWLTVGLKLLGVYFAILAVAILPVNLLPALIQAFNAVAFAGSGIGLAASFVSALHPVVYLACAFVLVRNTDWCLQKIAPETSSG